MPLCLDVANVLQVATTLRLEVDKLQEATTLGLEVANVLQIALPKQRKSHILKQRQTLLLLGLTSITL